MSQLTMKIPTHTYTDIFRDFGIGFGIILVKKCRSVFSVLGIFGICRYTSLLLLV